MKKKMHVQSGDVFSLNCGQQDRQTKKYFLENELKKLTRDNKFIFPRS